MQTPKFKQFDEVVICKSVDELLLIKTKHKNCGTLQFIETGEQWNSIIPVPVRKGVLTVKNIGCTTTGVIINAEATTGHKIALPQECFMPNERAICPQ